MKNYINAIIIISTFAQLQLFCDAGLLDLIIRGERRLLNRNHDNNEAFSDPYATSFQNAANPYASEFNNWRSPSSTSSPRDYGNKIFDYGTNTPKNNLQETLGGTTFTNRFGNGQGSANEFLSNNGNNNKPLDSGAQTTMNPVNREKIINDMKKINTILEEIRKQNAENGKTNLNGNEQEYNRYPNYNHLQPQPANPFSTVHINNGTNSKNNVPNVSTPQYTLHYNKPTTKRPHTNYDHPATNPTTETTVKIFTSAVINDPKSDNSHTPKPILSHPSHDNNNISPPQPKHIDEGTKRDEFVLKPITKRKLFVQVEPIVPEDRYIKHNDTVYYIDK